MPPKLVCFAFICDLLMLTASAQQVFTLRGIITRQQTGDRISQVAVHNLKSNAMAMTDQTGVFSIMAAVGDTLEFSKLGYALRRSTVINSADVVVGLQEQKVLTEIVIKDRSVQYEQNALLANYREKGLYFDGSPPLAIFNPISGSPLTGLHELLGKDAAYERRFIKFTHDEQTSAYIDSRFTRSLVKSITNLREEELTGFMDGCRPDYEDLKTWSDYQLRKYIKAAFGKWHKKA